MIRNHPCDVFIAGAGPAGLAAAIALRSRGADVLVADRLHPPIDKPCGEGLLPEAVAALAALGIVPESRGVPFAGITFADLHSRVSADFPATHGVGIRRTILHELLYERASALGVRFLFNMPVVLGPDQPPTLAGRPVGARWIVGADGAASRVRAWAGLERGRMRSRRLGFRAHFRLLPGVPPPTHVEVHWGPLGQAYITPTATSEVCISAMTRDPAVRLAQVIESLPSVRALVHSAEPVNAARGCATVTRRLRRVTHGNVALVGDASGSVDAITGEGLALAFRQALLLAESLTAGSLNLYESRHRSLFALPQRMAALLMVLDRHPQLRARTLSAFAADPALFRALLFVHVGEEELPAFLLRHGAALAAGILIASSARRTEGIQAGTEPAL